MHFTRSLLRVGLLLLLGLPLLGYAQAASRHTPAPITVQDEPRPGG